MESLVGSEWVGLYHTPERGDRSGTGILSGRTLTGTRNRQPRRLGHCAGRGRCCHCISLQGCSGGQTAISDRFDNRSKILRRSGADCHGYKALSLVCMGEVYDRIVSNIRAQVDESQWNQALAQGRGMLLPQAIALAIEELKNPIMEAAK